MHITVIGSGYVGLVTALCLAEIGHQVIAVDSDTAKIEALTRGEAPIHEALLPELLQRHNGQRLRFSAFPRSAVTASDVVFLAVGTPQSDNGEADLSQVEAVAKEIAPVIHRSTLIVEKSTVPVCTSERLREILCGAGARAGWFSVASNPEFLREGSAVTDFLFPDRIVAGVDDEFSGFLLQEVYRPLTSGAYYRQEDAVPCPRRYEGRARWLMTSAKSAELIKHASNAFLATKISYINTVARLAEAVGADIDEVCAGMGSDPRIGGEFLRAGVGYGGSCFPKDVAAFAAVARRCGVEFSLLRDVAQTNEEQRWRFVERVRRAMGPLDGKRIGVLGLAFKEDTDDVRESPAIAIVRELARQGAAVCAHDPAAMERARAALWPTRITYAHDEYDAACGSEGLLILTGWRQFAKLDLQRLHSVMKAPVIFDGRNLYAPEEMVAAGFAYHSVGRMSPAVKRTAAIPVLKREPAGHSPDQPSCRKAPQSEAGPRLLPAAAQACVRS
ncbi:MAG TPA: UDP-glucose/GDP-mannose dehydrogenase family protein [Candidatus Bathyarchaeia archaeon]|nr:UDP-glucose/GDP-mannose dehydrogenase family protein [Candidatus Bathyarchaeia archaeon]